MKISKIKNSTILITGGTGSFGNSVVKELIKHEPKRIIIYSRDEKKQFDMRNKFDNPILRFVIGDVRSKESVENAMEGVDFVFHAAALKHVPTCEFFPIEAVKTNIIGINNVLNAAKIQNVKCVVALSTDKAVYPINAMGMSKAMMEKVIISEAKKNNENSKSSAKLCVVRYGNVLYTRGSVIPYFIDLIKQNKKLPITHPEMTRFLLPLSYAIKLVIYALENGENGHIYVRKSPAATVETIALALCKIFNYKKGYYHAGIRAGEKMHETLISQEEAARSFDLGTYYKISPETHGLDYNKYYKANIALKKFQKTFYRSDNTIRLDVQKTINMLSKIPEIKNVLKS